MLKIIGIVAAVILGAFVGRIASNLMNKDEITINPVVCLIVGIVGGGLGGWLGSLFALIVDRFYELLLLQIGTGVVLTAFLLLLLFLLRERREDPIDDAEVQDEN